MGSSLGPLMQLGIRHNLSIVRIEGPRMMAKEKT